jgi:hypothetical protein
MESDLKTYLKSVLIRGWPRGEFLLADTGSAGLALWTAGSKDGWTVEI